MNAKSCCGCDYEHTRRHFHQKSVGKRRSWISSESSLPVVEDCLLDGRLYQTRFAGSGRIDGVAGIFKWMILRRRSRPGCLLPQTIEKGALLVLDALPYLMPDESDDRMAHMKLPFLSLRLS